jgi:hypothetical protein
MSGEGAMPGDFHTDRMKDLRAKLLEHLEAALAVADECKEAEAGYMIERALDAVRANHWPSLDPNIELFRKGKR